MSSAENQNEFSALFVPESSSPAQAAASAAPAWKILIVDDEEDVHALFRLALQGVEVEGRALQLLYASSAAAAQTVLAEHPDVALVLLDVVMESAQAGLMLAQYIRQTLQNRLMQILLITGQPGYAPQRSVVMNYEINGYRLKSELTADKIFVSIYAAIRTHHTMLKIVQQQQLLDEAERRAQEDRMLKAFIVESSEDAIIGKTLDGIVTSWNRAAEKIFGYRAEEMIGRALSIIIPSQRMDEDNEVMRSIIQGDAINLFETERITKVGYKVDVFMTISAIRDREGRIVGISEISRDITERKQAETKLRLAANVFTHAREAIMITDLDATIIDVNDTFSRMTGYSREEVLGKNPRLLGSGRQNKAFYADMWQALIEHGHWYGEIWNRRKNGEVYAEMKNISTVRDAQGQAQHYVALCSDITLLKEHEKQLDRIAHYDVLTGLPNRVLLADRLHQSINATQRRGLRLGVIFMDMDGFKSVNDKYGHDVGDQLLMQLSARMKQTLRDGDTLSRIGGDEFIVVLPDLENIEACLPMLNRLLAAAAEPVTVGELSLQVSASLGVTFFPQPLDTDADQLIRQADQAMYQAKLAGKNRYHVFDPELDSSIRTYHESQDRIRRALVEKEFVLYYQPKVNMRSGEVIGAEALIRWQHPEQGLLSPALFLPMIEEHALAVEIGEWVIDTALTQIEQWQSAGLRMPVSVNVGARQLQQKDFVDRLRTLLADHPKVNPRDIELEALETSAMEDIMQVSYAIKACQEIGIRFALDDFGTGYSSLTYLKRLPVAQLKIDQSFVRDMLVDPDDLAILEGVLSLATAFRREVIAEGVESVEHGDLLLQFGCELAQGYGIAHPMPAHELPAWVATWHPNASWSHMHEVGRDDLPLLYAGVEHSAWMAAIEGFIKGECAAPLPQDHTQCHFGLWLNRDGMARYGAQAAFQSLQLLHQQTHSFATELLQLHLSGHNPKAQAKLRKLHELRDALLETLKIFAQGIR